MNKYFGKKITTFTKQKKNESGYVLLFLMLIIGSLGLYWSYQLSLTKMNTQSWQLTKTATEFSYWFDVEQNYEQDYSIINAAALNSIQLNTLIQNHYLPYGMARTPTFASRSTPAVSAISEFQCSPLPGITLADGNLSDSGLRNNTCPAQTSSGPIVQCSLNEPAYYSCVTNSAIGQAQYYVNANYIALSGDNISPQSSSQAPIALGLIVRTPGFSNTFIDLGTSGSRGLLPNDSYAQSLITTLPSSSFNLYGTDNPEVKGIGIGSYLSIDNSATSSITPVANNRYSKIIDMGLVQAVDLSNSSATKCYGWDTNGNKLGTNTSYTGSNGSSMSNSSNFPPTCIRINMAKYGPGGSEKCARLDLFYTMYRNYIGTASNTSRFLASTNSMVTTSAIGNNYADIYLGQNIQDYKKLGASYDTYSNNGTTPNKDKDPEEYNWLAYFLRCTRNNV